MRNICDICADCKAKDEPVCYCRTNCYWVEKALLELEAWRNSGETDTDDFNRGYKVGGTIGYDRGYEAGRKAGRDEARDEKPVKIGKEEKMSLQEAVAEMIRREEEYAEE